MFELFIYFTIFLKLTNAHIDRGIAAENDPADIDPRFRRIYNPDQDATIKEFPFMVAVMMNNRMWCGGVVIADDKVLTAAHCLQLQYNNRFFREYMKMISIRVGSTNTTYGGSLFGVSQIYFHPNYNANNLNYNIAIMRLNQNLSSSASNFTNIIKYSHNTEGLSENFPVTFVGWNAVMIPLPDGDATSEKVLQRVDLPIYNMADCKDVYGAEIVRTNNFCAGFVSKNKNVCNHDTGGPALVEGTLVGILSFTNKRCDQLDRPAVFTHIGMLSDWIDSVISNKANSFLTESRKTMKGSQK